MKTQLIIALKFTLIMTLLTGLIYPLMMTGLSQWIFPYHANGSIVRANGKIIGSELIGQKFDSTIYFWSRPSAIDYNPIPSGASNYGPTSDKLKKQIADKKTNFSIKNNLADTSVIPIEMLTTSGSGLDPHISLEAALLQVDRIEKNRKLSLIQKQHLSQCIKDLAEEPAFTCLGNERINVLLLNIELDKLAN